jgi:hypothetical protein
MGGISTEGGNLASEKTERLFGVNGSGDSSF